nr:unnamed protein product [Callosobruchus chinensis]
MFEIFTILLLLTLRFLLSSCTNETHSNCGEVIKDKEFVLQFPNNKSANGTCKFRVEGPDCPTWYTLNFEQFKLKDSANCTEDKLEVNGNAICGVVQGAKKYLASNGTLALELKARSAPVVKVFVNRTSCLVGLGARTKEVEETTKMDVSLDIQKLQLLNERTEILDDEDNNRGVEPAVFKSIYFFAAPEASDPEFIPNFHHTQKERLNPMYNKCIYRNRIENYFPYRQNCRNEHNRDGVEQECVELNYLRGYFRSPGYPFYYPANLNMCYRFKVQPGFCAVRIFMNDFQLEDSVRCSKDYFLIPGDFSKHCGVDLFGRTVTLDLSTAQSLDVQFRSDAYWCGRGFSGVYEQIACQQPYNPINPPHEITTTEKPESCNAVFRDRRFSLRVDSRFSSCHFRVFKSSSVS